MYINVLYVSDDGVGGLDANYLYKLKKQMHMAMKLTLWDLLLSIALTTMFFHLLKPGIKIHL